MEERAITNSLSLSISLSISISLSLSLYLYLYLYLSISIYLLPGCQQMMLSSPAPPHPSAMMLCLTTGLKAMSQPTMD
jgi:hypothetical protein